MNTTIIKIGDSKDLIIPKKMLEQLDVENEVKIEYRGGGLFISPIQTIRKGWAEAFKKSVKEQQKAEDPFESIENDFDKEEWTW